MPRFTVLCLIPLLAYLLHSQPDQVPIQYIGTQTIPFQWEAFAADTVFFDDALTGQAFYEVKTLENIPLFFGQDIFTEVCFDKKCRMLSATIYWNITGRYLGFKLPSDEYFSRKDHDPFLKDDYVQLHALLADPFLPLDIPFEDLIQAPTDGEAIDGMTGATSRHISSFVVRDAAYTTHTMWNIIYGSMQTAIAEVTESRLSDTLLALILQSASSSDKIWAIDRIDKGQMIGTKVKKELLKLLEGPDFFVAHTALNAISPLHLNAAHLQIDLISAYQRAASNLRKPIIEKLQEASSISSIVIDETRDLLPALGGIQLISILKLYEQFNIEDSETLHAVSKLLNSSNAFIGRQAYQFLSDLVIEDDVILQAMENYEAMK